MPAGLNYECSNICLRIGVGAEAATPCDSVIAGQCEAARQDESSALYLFSAALYTAGFV